MRVWSRLVGVFVGVGWCRRDVGCRLERHLCDNELAVSDVSADNRFSGHIAHAIIGVGVMLLWHGSLHEIVLSIDLGGPWTTFRVLHLKDTTPTCDLERLRLDLLAFVSGVTAEQWQYTGRT